MPLKKSVSTAPARTRKTPTKPLTLVPPPMPADVVDSEAVARRAYELFVEQGWQHGHDVDHWLRAEQELLGRA